MGKFKEIRQFEKENMTPYQYNFAYRGLLPGIIIVIGGALAVVVFVIVGEAVKMPLLGIIPACIWGVATFILTVLFVVYSRKITKRLIVDKTAQFENEYKLIDYERAESELAKENIIEEGKLIIHEDDIFETVKKIDVENCHIVFYCKTLSGAYIFCFDFFDKRDKSHLMRLKLNQQSCTYFANNLNLISNKSLFELFVNDKEKFLRLLYRYNDHNKMETRIHTIR